MTYRTIAAALIAVAVFSVPAQAQQCAPKSKVMPMLAEEFSERPVLEGVADGGARVIVTASPAGSWSFVILMPQEKGETLACIQAGGEALRIAKPEKAPDEEGPGL